MQPAFVMLNVSECANYVMIPCWKLSNFFLHFIYFTFRDCFLSYFVHKFRSTIGKSKQIRPGDRVLIAISGGLSSSALLHLIRDGLDESSHKKLRFEPTFIYIDGKLILLYFIDYCSLPYLNIIGSMLYVNLQEI